MNKIQKFNELHTSKEVLFLGNAWDILSALTLEKVGFKAIGTTSWGIANSFGYADGELIDFEKHLGIIKTITENVKIPVSADIEAGYGDGTEQIVTNVLKTADVGVAGINIEDSLKKQKGLRDILEHCNLLSKIRSALDKNGYKNFYINARTDTYLQSNKPLLETIDRAKSYVESGASGIFVPGLIDHDEIRKITMIVNAPLNVLSLPGLTNCNKLRELGVKRFSFGNALSDHYIAFLEKNAERLVEFKDTSHLYED
ncbi:isocitrate lyase/PEP mutase family protein [Metabacillus sediminilitoris]|uniref:Isocitrate lyase/phosphoenolpyruvate mutase family protein n=1 Tax=Metabacillus sediminilitoris TaxID=2567941 RepID=A0A4S4BSE0_9BACI|nr:isocitrate lyase/phosphoenolpyruvate mutase family protein [Metabacillus sediminilitoris]QGQ48528.1 isocitrate lyase/phosphoenolpyruvate mutase family protein [Metabacillus sediminilitoris]THF77914.1 isocitrate lyase/phosphoenolpyruvate mutase family protein [Metabacillus sediminilitoris]